MAKERASWNKQNEKDYFNAGWCDAGRRAIDRGRV